jgi:integrase
MAGKGKRRGRGEGSIEQLPSGKFRVVISAGFDPSTGRRLKITGTFDTKKEAAAWRDDQLRQLRAGHTLRAGSTTVRDWVTHWLAVVRATVTPNTHHFYDRTARRWVLNRLRHLCLADLSVQVLERTFAAMAAEGISAAMVRKAATVLGVALQKAVKDGLIPNNPAHLADKPAWEPEDVPVMTADQVRQFLAAARDDRLFAMYALWVDAGAREGEVFALRWSDVDWDAGAVSVTRSLEEIKGRLRLKEPKTRRGRRKVVLSPGTVGALAGHRKRMLAEGHYGADKPVFCDTEGGWLRKSNVQRRSFNVILAAAGLPHFTPYSLRHCSATLLLEGGTDTRIVSDRLGHSTTRLTQDTYQHVTARSQEKAATQMQAALWGDDDKPAEAAG